MLTGSLGPVPRRHQAHPKSRGRGRLAIQSEKPSYISAPKTGPESQVSRVVPDFGLCLPWGGFRLRTITFQRKSDSSTQTDSVRARWFSRVRGVSQRDL